MPYHPTLVFQRDVRFASAHWHAAAHDTKDINMGGIAFDEAELTAMRSVLDEVCMEVAPEGGPEEREFIAWLIVRLHRTGAADVARLKSAALAALRQSMPNALPV